MYSEQGEGGRLGGRAARETGRERGETEKEQVERETWGMGKGTEEGPALPLTSCHGPRQSWADNPDQRVIPEHKGWRALPRAAQPEHLPSAPCELDSGLHSGAAEAR